MYLEPCNFASNIAYYHMAQGVCNYRQVTPEPHAIVDSVYVTIL
jgi:hypothetical protein